MDKKLYDNLAVEEDNKYLPSKMLGRYLFNILLRKRKVGTIWTPIPVGANSVTGERRFAF
jgi:hypothetical protein